MRTEARELAWIRAVWHHVGTNSADRGPLVQVAPLVLEGETRNAIPSQTHDTHF